MMQTRFHYCFRISLCLAGLNFVLTLCVCVCVCVCVYVHVCCVCVCVCMCVCVCVCVHVCCVYAVKELFRLFMGTAVLCYSLRADGPVDIITMKLFTH